MKGGGRGRPWMYARKCHSMDMVSLNDSRLDPDWQPNWLTNFIFTLLWKTRTQIMATKYIIILFDYQLTSLILPPETFDVQS